MNRKNFQISRVVAVIILTSVFTFAFVWTNPSASEQINDRTPEQKTIAAVETQKSIFESEANAAQETPETVTLKAERRGYPLINLQDGKKLRTKFVAANGSPEALSSAQPRSLNSADLNLDGAADLIAGYADGNTSGGYIAVYPGNTDALSARTDEIFEGIKQGRFPTPFLSQAGLIALPVAPDFIGTGDFNRDGLKDILAAERGGNSLVLLAGNSKGNYDLQNIELPGRVTALLADNINPEDGQADAAIALADANGAWMFVFDNQQDIFAAQPKIYPLPAKATSLALGQLDEAAPLDILAAAGGKAVVIRGSYSKETESAENQVAENARQVEALNAGSGAVAAVRVGHFVWDRENRPEIALLDENGRIEILRRARHAPV